MCHKNKKTVSQTIVVLLVGLVFALGACGAQTKESKKGDSPIPKRSTTTTTTVNITSTTFECVPCSDNCVGRIEPEPGCGPTSTTEVQQKGSSYFDDYLEQSLRDEFEADDVRFTPAEAGCIITKWQSVISDDDYRRANISPDAGGEIDFGPYVDNLDIDAMAKAFSDCQIDIFELASRSVGANPAELECLEKAISKENLEKVFVKAFLVEDESFMETELVESQEEFNTCLSQLSSLSDQ